MENILIFLSENFMEVIFSLYLNRRIFVMICKEAKYLAHISSQVFLLHLLQNRKFMQFHNSR